MMTTYPQSNRLSNGYTLIEILIVLFILSIVTSVALLSIGRNDNKRFATFADELTETISLAKEQALLQSSVLGLTIEDHALHFGALSTEGGKNQWLPLQDNVLQKYRIPSGIQLTVRTSDSTNVTPNHGSPQIIISANGELTPFTIYIGKPNEKPRYVVIGDEDGDVTNKTLS